MAVQKKLLRPFEAVLLVVGLLLVAMIAFQKKTGQAVQVVENQQFTNGFSNQTPPPDGDPLSALAHIFSKKQGEVEPEFWQKIKLPEAEKDFFKSLRNRFSEQKKQTTDWLSILQAARLTYQKVDEIFAQKTMADSSEAEQIFLDFEQLFKIPRESARSFSRSGDRDLNDWALFVEENQK